MSLAVAVVVAALLAHRRWLRRRQQPAQRLVDRATRHPRSPYVHSYKVHARPPTATPAGVGHSLVRRWSRVGIASQFPSEFSVPQVMMATDWSLIGQ